MNDDQLMWQAWARFLRRWGADRWAAALLESVGAFSILGAQCVYLCQPLLHYAAPENQLAALARLLEDTTRTQAFAKYLREASEP